MPPKKGYCGVPNTGEWIVVVEYPLSLGEDDMDDLLDSMCGPVSSRTDRQDLVVVQCWGAELPDGMRRLLYAYNTQSTAMAVAKKFEAVLGVTHVDVYDKRYPNG